MENTIIAYRPIPLETRFPGLEIRAELGSEKIVLVCWIDIVLEVWDSRLGAREKIGILFS